MHQYDRICPCSPDQKRSKTEYLHSGGLSFLARGTSRQDLASARVTRQDKVKREDILAQTQKNQVGAHAGNDVAAYERPGLISPRSSRMSMLSPR